MSTLSCGYHNSPSYSMGLPSIIQSASFCGVRNSEKTPSLPPIEEQPNKKIKRKPKPSLITLFNLFSFIVNYPQKARISLVNMVLEITTSIYEKATAFVVYWPTPKEPPLVLKP